MQASGRLLFFPLFVGIGLAVSAPVEAEESVCDPTLGKVIATGVMIAGNDPGEFPYAVISDYRQPGGFIIRAWTPFSEIAYFGVSNASGNEITVSARGFYTEIGSSRGPANVGEFLSGRGDDRSRWTNQFVGAFQANFEAAENRIPFINQEVSGTISATAFYGKDGKWRKANNSFKLVFVPDATTEITGEIREVVDAFRARFASSALAKVKPEATTKRAAGSAIALAANGSTR